MGTIFVDNLEPQSGTSLTLGASGDTVSLTSGAKTSGFGKVGQVVTTSAAFNTTISSTSLVEMDSNVRITITPSTSTSKILYMLSFPFLSQANQTGFFINIYKSVGGASYADDSGELSRYTGYGSNDDKYETATFHYLSSPSTTSAVIYTPYVKVNANNINYGNAAKFNATVLEILD
jgi:hypothetical protein